MIVVDSSVWVAHFNHIDHPKVDALLGYLAEGSDQVVVLPAILMEVLQGFQREEGFEGAYRILRPLVVPGPFLVTHVEAARLYRRLRKRGITIRGLLDCLIAAFCMEQGAALLTMDRDFEHIAAHEPLGLV